MIDAHAHACGELHSIDGILEYLRKNRLDKVVLCPGEPDKTSNRAVPMISNIVQSPKLGYGFNKVIRMATSLSGVAKHIDGQNRIIAEFAKEHPKQIIQAYWVNPLESDCIEKMEKNYSAHKFCVVKMHQCWHDFDILQNTVESIVRWSSNKCLPVFIHLLSRGQTIRFSALANKFPHATFIIGHMIGYEDIVANCASDNVFFDISAPYLITDQTIKDAIKTVGSNRLILGSDTPYGKNNIEISVNRIRGMGIGAEAEDNIFGNNFMKLLEKTQS